MRKIALLLTVLFGLHTAGFTQGCLPDGITFTTQAEIDNFPTNYPGCTEIEGDVTIYGPLIYNLDCLSNVTSMGGYLDINSCIWLTNLNGLSNLTYLGKDLMIASTAIVSFSPLQGLTNISGELMILYNDSLVDLSGLENITSIDGGYFDIIGNNSLINLSGLEGLISITGNLSIWENSSLVSLEGINSLSSITQNLGIMDNDSLVNMEALSQITTLGASLIVKNNAALVNLSGLEKLTSIGKHLRIINNDNLINLNGLEAVSTISGELNINNNDELISLEGLGDFGSAEIDSMQIFENPKLSLCEIQGVCNYISSSGAIINIYDNDTGCNNVAEVDSACQYAYTPELLFSDFYSIYPVPANDKLHISTQNNAVIDNITIFNQYGQRVIFIQPGNSPVDISILTPGLYIIEIKNRDVKLRDRFIVK